MSGDIPLLLEYASISWSGTTCTASSNLRGHLCSCETHRNYPRAFVYSVRRGVWRFAVICAVHDTNFLLIRIPNTMTGFAGSLFLN